MGSASGGLGGSVLSSEVAEVVSSLVYSVLADL